jgi:hypothetical protein
LRFENPKVPATVPVEIKWAEKWSTNVLLERLENQLVGQYLRAENVHFGIFLVARIDRKRTWNHPADNRRIGFDNLILLLEEKAKELGQLPGVFGISVIGIDFAVPTTPPQSRPSSMAVQA